MVGELHFDYATAEYDAVAADVAKYVARGTYFTEMDLAFRRYAALIRMDVSGLRRGSSVMSELVRANKKIMSAWVAWQSRVYGWQGWLPYGARTDLFDMLRVVYPDIQDCRLNMSLIWQLANWVSEGRRLFDVSEGLARRLQTVDVQGYPAEGIALPYRTIALRMPPGVGWIMPDLEGRIYDVHTIYVTDDPEGSCGEGNSLEEVIAKRRIRRLEIFAAGQWRKTTAVYQGQQYAVFDDQMYHWSMPIGEIKTIDCHTATGVDSDLLLRGKNGPSWAAARLDELSRWVTYLLIYLSDSNIRREPGFLCASTRKAWDRAHKHPKGSAKHKRAVEEARKLQQQRVIRIGGDVQPRPPGANTGRKLEVRQYVRPHRKRVPIGPGGQDRKEVTIGAYWRGPEGAGETNSRYLLL